MRASRVLSKIEIETGFSVDMNLSDGITGCSYDVFSATPSFQAQEIENKQVFMSDFMSRCVLACNYEAQEAIPAVENGHRCLQKPVLLSCY